MREVFKGRVVSYRIVPDEETADYARLVVDLSSSRDWYGHVEIDVCPTGVENWMGRDIRVTVETE